MRLRDLRGEIRPMLALGVPVVLGELAWMAMGVVDTMMVGRVSAEAVGALGIGRVLFMGVAVFGIGLLLGLDTLASRAFGARDPRDGIRALVNAVYLALVLAVPLTLVYRAAIPFVGRVVTDPEVMRAAAAYMRAVGWCLLPALVYTAFRRYLQAVNLVRPVMLSMISANLVNVAANWVLIFGHLGAPALGAAGAGWATLLSLVYMTSFLVVATALHLREQRIAPSSIPWRVEASCIRALLSLGLPAAVQLVLEVGIFALATVLAGRLDPASLAAHQIALTVASVTFMVPLGVSSACAVRVGQALGRRDPGAAGRAGWTGILLASVFMSAAAAVLVALPGPIMRLFTTQRDVIAVGVSLLMLAAVFQLFDGVQVTTIGALRGAGDTRNPMLINLVGYWFVALPLGATLCFAADRGVFGLWTGLTAGLVLVAAAVLRVWATRVRRMLTP